MIELYAWLFVLGGVLGFVVMLVHSSVYNSTAETLFIFGAGFVLAFLLEYSLSVIANLYSYTNLPLTVFTIPIVIPCGWIVTFYGLFAFSKDFCDYLDIESDYQQILLTGFFALLYGFGIEILARNIQFWEFHFPDINIGGVPLIVPFAWGLTVINFSSALMIFRKMQRLWPIIILSVHIINLTIAFCLIWII